MQPHCQRLSQCHWEGQLQTMRAESEFSKFIFTLFEVEQSEAGSAVTIGPWVSLTLVLLWSENGRRHKASNLCLFFLESSRHVEGNMRPVHSETRHQASVASVMSTQLLPLDTKVQAGLSADLAFAKCALVQTQPIRGVASLPCSGRK